MSSFLVADTDLVDHDYPREGPQAYDGFRRFNPPTESTKTMVAVDCEMVQSLFQSSQLTLDSV